MHVRHSASALAPSKIAFLIAVAQKTVCFQANNSSESLPGGFGVGYHRTIVLRTLERFIYDAVTAIKPKIRSSANNRMMLFTHRTRLTFSSSLASLCCLLNLDQLWLLKLTLI